ncbi:hypothetical protein [uncultured Nostoc sp.]|uniref:hypothetical protein n=1 Tax=uncultured Nostoc sp. TaxID=340711 RepID=UPI0035CC6D1D
MKVPEGPPDSSLSSSEFWYCFKDKCLEGGIEEFEEFFHPTKTPEPLHSRTVHPVQPPNTPRFDPGQAESLTQQSCPLCPIVLPQELALQKKDEENNESGVNQFVNLTDNASVPSDNVSNLDSPAVTGFEPVQEVNLAENSLDSLDSPSVTGFSPGQDGELINTTQNELSRPEFQVGDKVEFFNDSVRKWQVGIIKSVQLMETYFCSATIDYRGFKGQLCQLEIFRSDWIKFLH